MGSFIGDSDVSEGILTSEVWGGAQHPRIFGVKIATGYRRRCAVSLLRRGRYDAVVQLDHIVNTVVDIPSGSRLQDSVRDMFIIIIIILLMTLSQTLLRDCGSVDTLCCCSCC